MISTPSPPPSPPPCVFSRRQNKYLALFLSSLFVERARFQMPKICSEGGKGGEEEEKEPCSISSSGDREELGRTCERGKEENFLQQEEESSLVRPPRTLPHKTLSVALSSGPSSEGGYFYAPPPSLSLFLSKFCDKSLGGAKGGGMHE